MAVPSLCFHPDCSSRCASSRPARIAAGSLSTSNNGSPSWDRRPRRFRRFWRNFELRPPL